MGKKHAQIFYIQRAERHIPIQPAVLLTAAKANQRPYFTVTAFFASYYFLPEPLSWRHNRKIMSIKAMTATFAALVLTPGSHGYMRGVLWFYSLLLD